MSFVALKESGMARTGGQLPLPDPEQELQPVNSLIHPIQVEGLYDYSVVESRKAASIDSGNIRPSSIA